MCNLSLSHARRVRARWCRKVLAAPQHGRPTRTPRLMKRDGRSCTLRQTRLRQTPTRHSRPGSWRLRWRRTAPISTAAPSLRHTHARTCTAHAHMHDARTRTCTGRLCLDGGPAPRTHRQIRPVERRLHTGRGLEPHDRRRGRKPSVLESNFPGVGAAFGPCGRALGALRQGGGANAARLPLYQRARRSLDAHLVPLRSRACTRTRPRRRCAHAGCGAGALLGDGEAHCRLRRALDVAQHVDELLHDASRPQGGFLALLDSAKGGGAAHAFLRHVACCVYACCVYACCMLHVACCVLHVACGVLRVACCMLRIAWLLFAWLHVACCRLLRDACCMLHVACCMLQATSGRSYRRTTFTFWTTG